VPALNPEVAESSPACVHHMPAVHVLSTFLLMQLFLGLKSGHDVLICTGNHKPISFFESIDKEATENCTDAVGVGPYPNT